MRGLRKPSPSTGAVLRLESLGQARDAIDELTKVGNDRLASVPHLEPLRREILETSLLFQRRFLATHKDNPELRGDCGRALLRSAEIHEKLGRDADAEAKYVEARGIFEDLVKDKKCKPETRLDLAQTWNDLAILYQKRRKPDAARGAFGNAIRMKAELMDEFKGNPAWERGLANSYGDRASLYQATEKPAEAEQDYQAALKLLGPLTKSTKSVEDKELLARTYVNLGVVLTVRKPADAAKAYDEALPVWLELLRRKGRPALREQLALTYFNRGYLRQKTGRPVEEIEADYAEARKLFEGLSQQFRGVPEYRQNLANACMNLGLLMNTNNRPDDAEKVWRQVVPILTVLAGEFPEGQLFQQQLGRACNFRGISLCELNEKPEAEQAWRDGIKVQERLVGTDAANAAYWKDAAESRGNLAKLLAGWSPNDAAERAYEQLVDLDRRRAKAFPTAPECLRT